MWNIEHCETIVEPYITIVCLELPEAQSGDQFLSVSLVWSQ